MKKTMLFAAAAILALQAIPAMAEEGKPHHKGKDRGAMMEKMFDEQDTDKNGSISEAEFQAFSKKRFDEMDVNKDGSVSKDEVKAHFEAKKAEWKAKHEAEKSAAPAEKTAE